MIRKPKRKKTWFGRTAADRGTAKNRIFDGYEERLPSNQNAVDVLPGWNTAFAPHLNLQAGPMPLFEDGRIAWMIDEFGDIAGRRVLELGPLDAGQTSMLVKAGAHVEAIEANKMAYLRCLVAKEIYGFSNAKFLLGDFVKWLEQSESDFDLIVASGVLYHMRDPLRFLRAAAARSAALYIWAVCVTDNARVPSDVVSLNGLPIRLYKESYFNVETNDDFCGGMEEEHYWMHRDDILAALKALGFSSLTVAHEDKDHPFGWTFSVLARKTAPVSPPA